MHARRSSTGHVQLNVSTEEDLHPSTRPTPHARLREVNSPRARLQPQPPLRPSPPAVGRRLGAAAARAGGSPYAGWCPRVLRAPSSPAARTPPTPQRHAPPIMAAVGGMAGMVPRHRPACKSRIASIEEGKGGHQQQPGGLGAHRAARLTVQGDVPHKKMARVWARAGAGAHRQPGLSTRAKKRLSFFLLLGLFQGDAALDGRRRSMRGRILAHLLTQNAGRGIWKR